MLGKIYDRSPIWLQEIMITGYGIKSYMGRYKGNYKTSKKKYVNKEYSSYEQEKKFQVAELKKLLQHAKTNSKYYREVLVGIDINEIRSVEDIKKLPILEKEVLRERADNIITSKEVKNNTGGTTGKPLTTYFTKYDNRERIAYWDAFKEKHGIKLGMRAARFSGKNLIPRKDEKINKYWRTNWIINQRLYSTFHMQEGNLKYYVEDLNKFKPEVIDGFMSSIYEIAKYIEENNINLLFKPKVVFPTSEAVLPHHRELVERIFKCKVRNQYASSEGAPFITECTEGKLHYNMDTGIIEMFNEEGEILVTAFNTYGTPLIRYRIGDKIEFSEEKCSCGSVHPVVKAIHGRSNDYLFSKERGNINSGNMSNVIKYIPHSIKNTQFVQDKESEIVINIVIDKTKYKDSHKKKLLEEMKNRFGKEMNFIINKVDEIPREISGKFRFIKNNLNI